MNEKIGAVNLELKYYSGKDYYSDGEIEKKLLNIVQTTPVAEYEQYILQNPEWPILYHLSPMRENIIEWLPISQEEEVLEIGAGCGAITGILAKKAKCVDCIELSKRRSLINAYRHKEDSNINIIVGNFEDINFQKKYDVITLIGVYEYAASYIHSQSPYKEFLCRILKRLKRRGRLIIAIENKYGLKYWAGAREDHIGRYFEGIEDYPTNSGVRTFSKKELEELFKQLGIKKYKFYYPYPDYKLPQAIYSDEWLPKENDLMEFTPNFDSSRVNLFNEKKVILELIKEKSYSFFSNSYLIVIEKECE